eukprot:g4326.t1
MNIARKFRIKVPSGQSFVDASLRVCHDHFGTDDIPRIVQLLKSEEDVTNPNILETDDFLASQIILGEATPQRLAIRTSLARGLPLSDFQALADKLIEKANALRKRAFVECMEMDSSTCHASDPLLQCSSENVLKQAYEMIYERQSKPYMSSSEAKMIASYLDPQFRMIEYGSGGSTMHFSKIVAEYHSVEHAKQWCDVVKCAIGPSRTFSDKENTFFFGRNNVRFQCVPIGLDETSKCSYTNQNCAQYIDAGPLSIINDHREINRTFYGDVNHSGYDAVLIDGKGRAAIALRILPWLHANSVVFFHDFFSIKPSGCKTCPDIAAWHHILDFYDIVDSVLTGQTLAVLRPKRTMIGMSWDALNERTNGRANDALRVSVL